MESNQRRPDQVTSQVKHEEEADVVDDDKGAKRERQRPDEVASHVKQEDNNEEHEEEDEQEEKQEPKRRRISNGNGSGGKDSGNDPVMVEFKFCGDKTMLLKEGQMTGTLHIPMLQDPRTGRYRIRTVGK